MPSNVSPRLIHFISSQPPKGCCTSGESSSAYSTSWHKYQSFTASYSFALLPISPEKVALFVAYMGQQGLAVSTIEVYLAGLRYFILLANPGEASPSLHSPFLKLLLCGIHRASVSKQPSLVRLPITMGILAKIKSSLAARPSEYDSILLWAMDCTGFFAFLHTSEFLTPDNGPCDPASTWS